MDYITLLPYGNTSVNFYNEVNRSSSLTQQNVSGSVTSLIVQELISLLQKLPTRKQDLFNPSSIYNKVGISTVLAGWA